MKKLTETQKEQLITIKNLLLDDSCPVEKLSQALSLAKGISAELDCKIEKCCLVLDKLKKVSQGEVVTLSAENLPEKSKKQKKYKKMLLLLLTSVKDLQSEIGRISNLQTAAQTARVAATAKGPLGLLTVAAAGIVALGIVVNKSMVEVEVFNSGCPTIPINFPIEIPGMQLPKSIEVNKRAMFRLPSLPVTVNMTNGRNTIVTMAGFSKGFELPGYIRDISLDGQSLMGKTSDLHLDTGLGHKLVIRCQ